MTRIVATGVPQKYPTWGEMRITIEGTETEIHSTCFELKVGDKYFEEPGFEQFFDEDMKNGPSYPLCAEPETMRCALFILYEWFGEAESCWIKEPEHVKIEGEIEPMESEPGVIY